MQILSYVYICTHKQNGQFYIGYRERNIKYERLPEHDIGKFYFTSGVIKKAAFHEYHYDIIAHFFDPLEAYWFEQELIKENWGNPLLLNKQYYERSTSKGVFRHTGPTTGFTGRKHTEETKARMSRQPSIETRKLISSKVAGHNHPNYGKSLSDETRSKISQSRKDYYKKNPPGPSEKKGISLTPEHREKIRQAVIRRWAERQEKLS